ncbi:MAG: cob(I)yrinic acid a,c-diamide adenosyltransferase [Oscillospiraceae bacterium]|nr:cob(I)yrinic acid a,c-diamide adenosyltransferase [Oscillospiraceae bacterium]
MKIYTRTGDDGTTSLYGGERTEKHSLRVEAYGTLDELQAAVGLARSVCEDTQVKKALKEIEQQLVNVMTQTASPNAAVSMIKDSDVTDLERETDRLCSDGCGFSGFVLPGENLPFAALHFARTVARRAERRMFALAAQEPVDRPVLNYINRLSDYLFALSRQELKNP